MISEIQKYVKYPEKAKINKIEGKVLVKALIEGQGNVIKTEIVSKKRLG